MKNVLIIAPVKDRASIEIIDWLYFFGAQNIYKYSFADLLKQSDVNITSSLKEGEIIYSITVDGQLIDSVWFWRDVYFENRISEDETIQQQYGKQFNLYLKDEADTLRRVLFNDKLHRSFKMLSNSTFTVLNKLEVLTEARALGIIIPDFILTKQKKDVLAFKGKHEGIITKSIHENINLVTPTGYYIQYTEKVDEDYLRKMPDTFFPSYFQQMVEKELEIRSFYLDGKFYSMAIFSQNDEQTEVDFRRYNTEKWNRNVPFQLPEELENKLKKLMKTLNLNTGSVDLIKSKSGAYVFLEVNPNGQFGMVSKPCNYHLEREVARYLLS